MVVSEERGDLEGMHSNYHEEEEEIKDSSEMGTLVDRSRIEDCEEGKGESAIKRAM